MIPGELVIVCKATGERFPLREARRNGYDFIVLRVTTVKPYFLAFKAGTEPPMGPHASAKPEDVDAFFDDINRKVIADCKQQRLLARVRSDLPTDQIASPKLPGAAEVDPQHVVDTCGASDQAHVQ
jgi:hypothetical protein